MSSQETQLCQMIKEAQHLTSNKEIESCTQWIDREISKAKKLQDQIERLSKASNIPSKLFNEARDMGDQLCRFIDSLRSFRENMAKNGHQVVINTYEEARNSGILKNAAYQTEYKCPF